jgi:rhodanese-related sulfurtransferase
MEAPYRDLKLDQVRQLIGDGYEVIDVRENSEWQRG